jgi:predicted lactoylglutathione lyase
MKPKLPLVTLGVAEVGRSRGFYVALGFVALNSGSRDVVHFDLDGVVLGFYRRDALAGDAGLNPEGAGFAEVTWAINEPSVADADQVFGEFVAAGATVVKAMEPTDWGGYSGFVADLDGHLWEIAHNPHVDWG